MYSYLALLTMLYLALMSMFNRTLQLLVNSACVLCLAAVTLLTPYCRMSDGERKPVQVMRRTNGQKKTGVTNGRAPVPSLTAEDIAALDEEARLTKIAL